MQEPMSVDEGVSKQHLDYLCKIEKEKQRKNYILRNSSFMDNLERILKLGKKIVYMEDVSGLDRNKVVIEEQLISFFEIVKGFCDRNYIISRMDEEGISYLVMYKGVIIKVGLCNSDGMVYYARQVEKCEDELIISFDDIKEETIIYMEMSEKKKELLELYNYVRFLKMSGFADDEIVSVTAKGLKYVRL